MGHAAHFLSRLERLDAAEVELALELYRDPLLVKELTSAVSPASVEHRVALALSTEALGPTLIVTNEGGFITCLGRGMSPHGLPLVSRSTVDAALRRKRLEALGQQLIHEQKALFDAFVVEPALSREQMIGVARYQPVIAPVARDFGPRTLNEARYLHARCAANRESNKVIDLCWSAEQRLGHSLSLLGQSQPTVALTETIDALSTEVWAFGSLPACARSLQAQVSGGPRRFDELVRRLGEPQTKTVRVSTLLQIATLGFAHQSLFDRAQVIIEGAGDLTAPLTQAFCDPLAALHQLEGFGVAALERKGLAHSRFEAMQFELLQPASVWSDDGPALLRLVAALPFIAQCKAEELYLPRSLLDASSLKAPGRDVIAAHLEAASLSAERAPVVREAKVGRNDLCACGSGKKYKRCCA